MDMVIQSITMVMLGFGNPLFDSSAYAVVRTSWVQQGQPSQTIDEDVVYIRAIEVDDQYNRVRDVTYPDPLIELTQYTRVWEVHWTVYGPNSFDHARMIRSGLFTQAIHDQLAPQLYLVTDPSAPLRVPELQDDQWWERVDFNARFNEFVTESRTSQSVVSTEVIVDTAAGTILDVTVPTA